MTDHQYRYWLIGWVVGFFMGMMAFPMLTT
jgi:hypothetical protein